MPQAAQDQWEDVTPGIPGAAKVSARASDRDWEDVTPKQTAGPDQTLSKATAISAQPKPFTMPWVKQGLWRTAATTADALPALGATLGGGIGATAGGGIGSVGGAIGGAGMGGMGGEAGQQLMHRALGYSNVPQTSAEAAKDITKQGVIQAGIQGVTELLPPLAGPLSKAATSQYERALAPTTIRNKVIASKIAPELIERGEFGSLHSLDRRAGERIIDLKPQLDASYAATPASATVGSGTKIIQDLEDLKGKYIVNGQPANPS